MRVIDKIKLTNKNFIGRERRMRLVAKFSSIVLGLLVFATLSPIYIKFSGVEAVSGTANPSTTTLSLNVADNLLSLDLSPTSSYGTFASSSPASIQVSTNNVSGYTLSIKSSVVDTNDSNAVSNATNLVNTVDSTKVISSISTATSSSAFSTNTNTQYNNKWGYLPSKLNSLANTNYLPSPSYNEATILNTTTCANGITSAGCTTSATDTYTITLGARVDSTLPTGSYEHDFVLIAVGNPINYSITYHANDGADGADTTNMPTPNPQTGNADSSTTSVVLSTNKPRRAGKAFKGWCTVEPTIDPNTETDSCNNSTDGTGITYQPGADYGIDQTITNIVDLYAMWGPALTVNFNGNGLYFNNNTTDVINTIDYDAIYGTIDYTEKYSHTTNLDDAGSKINNANYPNSANTNEVITIPGASTLHIKLTWGGESANYDWVSFWAGNYPSYTASSNYSTGVKCAGNTTGKYGGGSHTATSNTIECDITGDVVTFAFKSDSGGVGDGYGYYAIINGYDASGNIVTMQKEGYSKTIASGEYKTPATAAGPTIFLGWSEDATATTPTYANESDIISNLPYVNGEGPITLYAIWNPIYTITYVNNCSTFNTGCSSSTSANISTQEVILTNRPSTGTEAITLGANNKFTQTGYKIKSWNTTASGSGTDYAAGTTYTVPAGSGAGSGITLYAHWVPVYTVQYDGNGADNPNGMGTANATTGIKPVRHYNVGEGDTFDLFASNFKRTGYGFVGWSTDSNAWTHLTDNDNTNDPKIWGPNEVITAPAYNGTPITTLYAVWVPAEKDGSNNPVYFQDWNGCSAMTATTYNSSTGTLTVAKNTVTALTDKRDGMVYAVAKLADGDCWMIENLRLDTAGTVGQNTIDSSVTNESLSQGYGGVFHGLANPETSNFSNAINTENSLYTTASGVTGKYQLTIDSSYSSYLNYLFPRYNNTNVTWNNNTSSATTPTSPSQNVTSTYAHTDYNNYVYSYGNYYTWAAVIANTIYYQNYNATGFWPNNSDSADTSLCPTGWKLPLGAYRGSAVQSFSHLDYIMGGNGNRGSTNTTTGATNSRQWRSFPNNFVYSGNFNGSSAYSLGKYGDYWSSSAYSSNVAYKLSVAGEEINPGATSNKDRGLSVRCVIDKSYRIVYDGNGATAGSMYSDGQVVKHAGLYDGDTITLIAPNYQKDGYGFAGWSPSPNATVGGTDPIYGPNETITVSSSVFGQYMNNRRQVTLYAVWVAKETNVTMQTFNSTNYAAYNSAPIGTVIALEDTRDNDVYAVARLADGKWWMIENLRLDAEDSRGTDNIAKAQGYGDATSTIYGNLGKFIGLADSENNNFGASYGNNTEPTEANSIYYAGSQSGTATINISQSYGAGFRIPRYNNNNTNRNLSASYNGSGNTIYYQWYGYGNYYNWAAAMANTGYYSSYNNSDAANTSICPKGWRLPLGYTSSGDIEQGESDTANRVGSFSYLDRKLGGTGANQSSTAGTTQSKKWRSFPYNFVYSGRTNNQSLVYDRNNNGTYWSSSVSYDREAYALSLEEDGINPGRSESSKASAKTVRCIAQ